MSNEDLEIQRHIALTEAKFQIIDTRIVDLIKDTEINTSDVKELLKNYDQLRNEMLDVARDIEEIRKGMNTLNSNVFLQFTNDIDIKKLVTIIVIICTTITSPALLTNWLEESSPEGSNQKLDKLIELLENQNGQ